MRLDHFTNVIKAIGDQNRLRAIMALRNGELCVCQIVELLQLAHSTVSKHMSILKQSGLVISRKKGRWVYYSLCDGHEGSVVSKQALQWIRETISKDQTVLDDEQRLEVILRMDPDELCKLKIGR